jgi:hypothetical protein
VQGRARKEAQSISVLARSLYGIASRLRASTRWSFWSVACRTFPFGTSRTSILGETTTRSDVRPCTATCTRHEKGTGSQGAGSIDAVPIREQHQSDASPMSGAPILGGRGMRRGPRSAADSGWRVAAQSLPELVVPLHSSRAVPRCPPEASRPSRGRRPPGS